MDDNLSKTDACEVALRFCQGLDQREASTTASHLRIVQEAVRDFSVAISEDLSERMALLEKRKAEIQQEIDALDGGVMVMLSDAEQRERLREIYQLASVLTGDFRLVEDEIRELGQSLRTQMIEEGSKRGEVLLSMMEKEALLAQTDAGSAFEGFFALLCDQNRTMELREQLRRILGKPVAGSLLPGQQQFLGQLMRELSRESERVLDIRRRTEERLRTYIESGAAAENQVVDQLLVKLERLAIGLRDGGVESKTSTRLWLPVGAVKIASPESSRLRMPDEKLDTTDVKHNENSRTPSKAVLDSLDAVRIREVARRIWNSVQDEGPTTLGALVNELSLTSGLEELVACIRVAKAVGATTLEKTETVEVRDKEGHHIKASIPTFIITSQLFPESLDDLII